MVCNRQNTLKSVKSLRKVIPRIFYLNIKIKGGNIILIDKTISIKITKKNIEYYAKKGYKVELGKELIIDTLDLQPGSEKRVKCICHYCGKEIEKMFCDYIKSPEKVCCLNCRGKKIKNIVQEKYGVDNVMQLDSSKEKIKNSCLKKYGVENPMQSKEIRQKAIATNIEKYGVDNPTKNKDILNKMHQTMLERYGVEHANQNEKIKEQGKNNCLIKYGVDNPMKNDAVKQKQRNVCKEKYGYEFPVQNQEILNKIKQTNQRKYGVNFYTETDEFQTASRLKGRNNAACSKIQEHICELYQGELNYPYDRCFLDMFFPDDNIYCEYDGGGHDLAVKTKKLTQEEFDKKQRKRQYFLYRRGLKEFRIISKKDYLPNDDILLQMKDLAFYILKNNISSYIIFDIDKSIVRWKNVEKYFKF